MCIYIYNFDYYSLSLALLYIYIYIYIYICIYASDEGALAVTPENLRVTKTRAKGQR